MKTALLVLVLLTMAASAQAVEMNSTNFRVRTEVLASGTTINSSSFHLKPAAIGEISGSSASTSFEACLGFSCVLPHLQISNLTTTSTGWNIQFNFTSLVSETEGQTVNISYYTSTDNSTWTFEDSATCADCNATSVQFTRNNYACGDIGSYFLKINATTGSLTHEVFVPFSVDKGIINPHNITFSSGPNATVTPNDQVEIVFQADDFGRHIAVANASARVFITGGTPTQVQCDTNSTGGCRTTFTPSCDFTTGTYDLIAGITGDSCYADVNSTAHNLEIDASAACLNRVTFVLDFNIDGKTGDTLFVDETSGASGQFNRTDLSKYYVCVQDSGKTDNPSYGMVFSGDTFDYINVTEGDTFTIEMSQSQADNKFLLPITVGGCTPFSDVTPVSGVPAQAFRVFDTGKPDVMLFVDYPVDIAGDFEASGPASLLIRKNATNEDQIIIEKI